MLGEQEMTALQLRKQTLLLESDLNRLTLLVECERLRVVGNWAGRLADIRKAVRPWALLLAPLAGIILTLGLRGSSLRASLLTRVLQVAPSLIQLWRAFASPSDKSQ
jgi:hypothetical protein